MCTYCICLLIYNIIVYTTYNTLLILFMYTTIIPHIYTTYIGIGVYIIGLLTRTAVHIRLLGEVLRGHEGK